MWDLSLPGARCTVDDLERSVHNVGLARFDGMQDLHHKVWIRDRSRYGSVMVFGTAEARDACMEWITERITATTGLPPARVETYDVIAVAEGSAGPIPPDRPQTGTRQTA